MLTQVAFRLRNDDGNETAATWRAALNTDLTAFADLDTNLRCRFLTGSNSGDAFNAPSLYYRLNVGTLTAVTGTSSVVRASDSTHLTDGENTTEQLGGAGSFTTGAVDDSTGTTTGLFLSSGSETEHEFCFQIRSADVTNGDIIELFLTDGGTQFGAYTEIPAITIALGDANYPHGPGAGFWLRLMTP